MHMLELATRVIALTKKVKVSTLCPNCGEDFRMPMAIRVDYFSPCRSNASLNPSTYEVVHEDEQLNSDETLRIPTRYVCANCGYTIAASLASNVDRKNPAANLLRELRGRLARGGDFQFGPKGCDRDLLARIDLALKESL